MKFGVRQIVSAVLTSWKRIWKKALLLCAVGVALSIALKYLMRKPDALLLPDMFFTIGSLFLFVGIWGVVSNLGQFNSTKYGTKSLFRILFNKKKEKAQDPMVGGYLEYIQSRPKKKDVPLLIALALVFILLSALCSVPFI